MAVRVLDCGPMRPFFPPVANGVTCLLVETTRGLALIDTGFGVNDVLRPRPAMRLFRALTRPAGGLEHTAWSQIRRLGYDPADVRDIAMTHLHIDHAGGLADFPQATVHLFQPELGYVLHGRAGWEYHAAHWAHGPRWAPALWGGERWLDWPAIRLPGLEPGVWLVPLVGHTPGHCGVAVELAGGWVFHAGDAAPFNLAFDEVPAWITRRVLGPHGPRIRAMLAAHPEVLAVGAHMEPAFYQRMAGPLR
jgi:glyoxylase-like metal-dependent hydrolase (beta-lactamase superfamily II)